MRLFLNAAFADFLAMNRGDYRRRFWHAVEHFDSDEDCVHLLFSLPAEPRAARYFLSAPLPLLCGGAKGEGATLEFRVNGGAEARASSTGLIIWRHPVIFYSFNGQHVAGEGSGSTRSHRHTAQQLHNAYPQCRR